MIVRMLMLVSVVVSMVMIVFMRMGMGLTWLVRMVFTMAVVMRMGVRGFVFSVVIGQVDIEFNPGDARFMLARGVEVIPFEPQLGQFPLQLAGLDSQIDQRPEEHVPADPAG